MIIRELVTRLGFNVDAGAVARFDGTLNQMRGAADRTANQIRAALTGAAIAGVAAIAAAIPALAATARAGDEMVGNLNKLEGTLGSAERAAEIYEKLYQTVRQTGADLNDTTTAFNNYNLAMGKNGKTAEDTVGLIGGLQAAMSSLGLSTAQVGSVTLQLGQALGKGVLNGDELVSLREAMPQLVDELRKALKLTDAQFSKAAEKGELTAEKLIGPLLAYADEAFKKLLALPPLMSRSTAILSTTWQRFLADLDKTLGLSQAIARGLNVVSGRLEDFRNRLPAFGAFLDRLGGIRGIMRVVAYSFGIGTAALIAFNAQLAIAAVRAVAAWAAMAAPIVAVGAVIVFLGALLDDFVQYVRGNTAGTLFGQWFGDFDKLVQPVKDAFTSLRAWINAQIEGMRPQVEWLTSAVSVTLTGAARLLIAAWQPVSAFFGSMWDGVVAKFQWAWNLIKPIADAVTAAGRALRGSGPVQEGEVTAPRRGGLNRSGLLGGFPTLEEMALRPPGAELAGRMGSAANTNNVSQTVNLGGVTVNATGVSGAEVASASQRGVGQALQGAGAALDPAGALSRRMRVAIPTTEGAAMAGAGQ